VVVVFGSVVVVVGCDDLVPVTSRVVVVLTGARVDGALIVAIVVLVVVAVEAVVDTLEVVDAPPISVCAGADKVVEKGAGRSCWGVWDMLNARGPVTSTSMQFAANTRSAEQTVTARRVCSLIRASSTAPHRRPARVLNRLAT
jgi:hypothetical protein